VGRFFSSGIRPKESNLKVGPGSKIETGPVYGALAEINASGEFKRVADKIGVRE
jgi:hypothetical protein